MEVWFSGARVPFSKFPLPFSISILTLHTVEDSRRKIISVSCALILNGEKVLAVKRSESMSLAGFWEFPGGKIEKGESSEECLKREIKEELALEVELVQPLTPVEYTYPAPMTIQLIPFLALIKSGEIRLAEHEEYRWLGQKELFEVNWAPADIPIVEELSSKWGCLIGKQ